MGFRIYRVYVEGSGFMGSLGPQGLNIQDLGYRACRGLGLGLGLTLGRPFAGIRVLTRLLDGFQRSPTRFLHGLGRSVRVPSGFTIVLHP